MRDLYNNISTEVAIAPAVQSATVTGGVIDLKFCNRMAFAVTTGAVAAAGDFGLKVQESDTTTAGDFTDASADVVDSDAPATIEATSAYRIGYRGFKRYVRLVATKAGGTSVAIGAVAVKSDLTDRPV